MSRGVIDLFAGCGGLSHGFIQSGFNVKFAIECDEMIARTYQNNHRKTCVIVEDIKNVDKDKVFKAGDADIIIGGPPCQGFSMAGARIRNGFIDDPRNYLFKHYFNIVSAVLPKVFVMENVKGIQTMHGGKIFQEILNIFTDSTLLGGHTFKMWHKLVKAEEFGVPQKRERMIILGVRDSSIDIGAVFEKTIAKVKAKNPTFFDRVTVRDAIGNLPQPTEDGVIKAPIPLTEYQNYLMSKGETISNHTATHHSARAIERMGQIESGQNFTVLKEDIKSVHSGSYGRLSWDEPAQTVTTRFDTPSGGRFIHPAFDRTLTPREAARLQSFPDDFVFTGTRTSICKQIGNAVPPKISYFLAQVVKNILAEEKL